MSLHKQIATLTLKPHWWKWVFPKTLPRICPLGSECEIRALIWTHSSKMKMKRSVSHFWILDLLSFPFHRESFVPGTLIFKLEKNNLNRGSFRTLILKIVPGSFIFKINDSYHCIGACISVCLHCCFYCAALAWLGSCSIWSAEKQWLEKGISSFQQRPNICLLSLWPL